MLSKTRREIQTKTEKWREELKERSNVVSGKVYIR